MAPVPWRLPTRSCLKWYCRGRSRGGATYADLGAVRGRAIRAKCGKESCAGQRRPALASIAHADSGWAEGPGWQDQAPLGLTRRDQKCVLPAAFAGPEASKVAKGVGRPAKP